MLGNAMNEQERTRISKRLARHLRHDPAAIGLTLTPSGWAPVDALLRALAITRDQLDEVVETNTKRRFAFDIYIFQFLLDEVSNARTNAAKI